MSKWSVIVFTRTYQADYRFLLIPDDFDQDEDEQNWARKYIVSLISNSNNLSNNPRWAMFKNEKHLIFGVACAMEDIIDENNPQQQQIISDAGRRPIRIFIGYVAQVNSQARFNDLPSYLRNNFKLFQTLFQKFNHLILPQWNLTSSQVIIQKNKINNNYTQVNFNNYISQQRSQQNYVIYPHFTLNENNSKSCFWTDNGTENANNRFWVWETACKLADFPEKSFSLCLGFQSYQEILNTPFLNGTANNVPTNGRYLVNRKEEKIIGTNSDDQLQRQEGEEASIFELIMQKINDHGLTIIPILTTIFVFILIISVWLIITEPDSNHILQKIVILIMAIFASIVGFYLALFAKNKDNHKNK